MKRNRWLGRLVLQMVVVFAFLAGFVLPAFAFDAEASRETLKGLTGFYVLIEELNPNIAKYANVQKNNISTQTLKTQVENRLQKAGIQVLSWDEMMKTPDRSMLYVSVNTHEYEKFWYAYDIRIEVRQLATLVSQPGKTISAATWSVNMTGVMNIGQLQTLYDNLGLLLDRFVQAYRVVNKK
jgi:type II secretory pathway component PulF